MQPRIIFKSEIITSISFVNDLAFTKKDNKDGSKNANIIKDEHLDTVQNNKSKPRIPFGSLIELGVIKPGTEIYDQKKKIYAKVMVDGSIKYKQNEGSIHKVAAQILGSESCNGWTYWHYQSGNSLKPIDELRQRLRPKN